MTRNWLVPVLLISWAYGCSGKIQLGTGDGGGDAGDEGGHSVVSTSPGMGVLAEGGTSVEPSSDGGTSVEPGSDGAVSIGMNGDGSSSTEPSDATVGMSEPVDAGLLPISDGGIPTEDALGGGDFVACGETQCGPGTVCVVSSTVDSGVDCEIGGCYYECVIPPAACDGEVTCECAGPSLCQPWPTFCAVLGNQQMFCGGGA